MARPRSAGKSLCFLVVVLVVAVGCAQGTDHKECSTEDPRVGRLAPADLPAPAVFTFDEARTTVTLRSHDEHNADPQVYNVATAAVTQINAIIDNDNNTTTTPRPTASTTVSHVAHMIPRHVVAAVLDMLSTTQLDEDPDTVDGMPTYEIFIDSPDLQQNHDKGATTKVLDLPGAVAQRQVLREQLQAVLQPWLESRITPLVRHLYPDLRACTPCFSLLRHYQHGQRQSHA